MCRPRVVMIVGGFPTKKEPHRSVFNLRAAQSVSPFVDLHVIFLRTWFPGRRLRTTYEIAGIRVTEVSVPQVPKRYLINVVLYRFFGWPLVRTLLHWCDLVHSVDALAAGIPASFWARKAGVRHVVQAIGSDVNSLLPVVFRNPVLTGWEKGLDGVICNSRQLAEQFIQLYPSTQNVQTVYRGVDLRRFNPEGTVAGPLATRMPVRFLYMGGFPWDPTLKQRYNVKGGETLIEAWTTAEDRLIPFNPSLLILGPGGDGDLAKKWRETLKKPENVFLSGPVAPGDVPSYIRSSDVVLVPSLREGLPNVLVEAAACGRPAVGSNVGGIPEVILQGESGFVVEPGSVPAWANILVECVQNASILRLMGERALKRVEAEFDNSRYGAEVVRLYQKLLSNRFPRN